MLLILALTHLFTLEVRAKIIINEFSSATSDDWIELYNNSENEVNINGYSLEDTASSKIREFGEVVFPPNAYCAIEVSNRLNNTGDVIILKHSSDKVDCIAYGSGNGETCEGEETLLEAPSDIQTASRAPNAGTEWTLAGATKGFSNNDTIKPEEVLECVAATPTPTPTKSPSDSPVPSVAPSTTLAPTPTPTPTKPATVAPKPSVQASSTPRETSVAKAVLALETQIPVETATPRETATRSNTGIVIVLLLVGAGCLVFSVYPLAKAYFAQKRNREVV